MSRAAHYVNRKSLRRVPRFRSGDGRSGCGHPVRPCSAREAVASLIVSSSASALISSVIMLTASLLMTASLSCRWLAGGFGTHTVLIFAFLLLLLGRADGVAKQGDDQRAGPSDTTWAGFDTLSSTPCLKTGKDEKAKLCLFGGRIRHMDGTPSLEPWFLPASKPWRDRVTPPADFGKSSPGWLRVVREREVAALQAAVVRAREVTAAAKQLAAVVPQGGPSDQAAASQRAVRSAEAAEFPCTRSRVRSRPCRRPVSVFATGSRRGRPTICRG